jgi:hypothetical protein
VGILSLKIVRLQKIRRDFSPPPPLPPDFHLVAGLNGPLEDVQHVGEGGWGEISSTRISHIVLNANCLLKPGSTADTSPGQPLIRLLMGGSFRQTLSLTLHLKL